MNNNIMKAETETVISRDARIAQHEAAHLTVGRVLGAEFGGATIVENTDLGYGGLCWGPKFQSRFADEECSTAIVDQIVELMPKDGDTRDDTAEIYQHVFARVVELTAGSEAERMQFGDNWPATDDRGRRAYPHCWYVSECGAGPYVALLSDLRCGRWDRPRLRLYSEFGGGWRMVRREAERGARSRSGGHRCRYACIATADGDVNCSRGLAGCLRGDRRW